MTPERAHEIVQAINARCLVTMGLTEDLPNLEGVTLAEMIEAKGVVESENRAEAEKARIEGGGYSISMVPDDRLIAAAYAVQHYPPGREPILYLPYSGWNGNRLALVVVAMDHQEDEEDEE